MKESRDERSEAREERGMERGNNIGNVRGIMGSSMALNTQKGEGGQKPDAKGNHDPGGTKPSSPVEEHVAMPK